MTTQEALTQTAFALRGRILELAIQMENLIDVFISEYFTDDKDKQSDVVFIILCYVGLKDKISIVEHLLRSTKAVSDTTRKKLIKNLNSSNIIRNTFAHWTIDFSNSALERYKEKSIITLVRRRPGTFKNEAATALRHLYDEETSNQSIKTLEASISYLKVLNRM